jgi:oligopeptide transport system ATP-binding protein
VLENAARKPRRVNVQAPLLEAENLVKHFPAETGLFARAGAVKAVDGVSFSLAAGETLALVGESGCGKSTVGRLVLRLIEPTAGRVRFEGEDIGRLGAEALRRRRARMQIIFQDPYGSLNPRLTVAEMLAEPLALHGLEPPERRRDRVVELLDLVGLAPEHARRYPHEFSGGQRQRLGIARALACRPKLIVCDEPVSALDVSIQAQVINLLVELQAKFGLAYLFIAHDLAVVRHIARRVAVMYLGRIVETAPTEAIFARPRHPYTQALLSSVPVPDPGARRRRLILDGDVPSPLDPPPGCHLHTRCPHAEARCRQAAPALELVAAGHAVSCHRWRDLPIPEDALPRDSGGESASLARLQAAFAARGRGRAGRGDDTPAP